MTRVERNARRIVEILDDGEYHDSSELMGACRLYDDWSGRVQFHQAVHYARMNLCRVMGREIATDRQTNRYIMPTEENWESLIYEWLPTFSQDLLTRNETEREMLEVWRINHGGHIPAGVSRQMNRLARIQREAVAQAEDVATELAEIVSRG